MNAQSGEIRKHRLSVADYFRIAEAGVFKESDRVELIEGEIYDMPPIGPVHISFVDRLTERFVLAAGRQAIVRVQAPITLGDLSAPEPDISLLRRRDDYYEGAHAIADDVLLIVEVADSSLRYDRDIKLKLYARHGIPEVWLIDVQSRKMTCYTTPESGGYRDQCEPEVPGAVELSLLAGVSVDLADMVS